MNVNSSKQLKSFIDFINSRLKLVDFLIFGLVLVMMTGTQLFSSPNVYAAKLVYADKHETSTSTDPRVKEWDGSSFGAEGSAQAIDKTPEWVVIKASSNNDEMVMVSLTRGIEILAEDDTGITLEIKTGGFGTTSIYAGAQEFERLKIGDYTHGWTNDTGRPEVPVKGMPKRMDTLDGTVTGGAGVASAHQYTVHHELDEGYWPEEPGDDGLERWMFGTKVLGSDIDDPAAGLSGARSSSGGGGWGCFLSTSQEAFNKDIMHGLAFLGIVVILWRLIMRIKAMRSGRQAPSDPNANSAFDEVTEYEFQIMAQPLKEKASSTGTKQELSKTPEDPPVAA